MDPLDAVVVLTTWPAATDASVMVTTLVEERLAACVSLLPEMESSYRWQGRVARDRERQVIIKTTRERVGALKERLLALHPYEVPEFLVLPVVDGAAAYLAWLRGGPEA